MRNLVSIAIAFLLAISLADAATLYVNNSGSPACSDLTTYANNTASLPWCTIGRACWGNADKSSAVNLQAAQAGDVVLVTPGIYSSGAGTGIRYIPAMYPVNSGTAGNPITIRKNGTGVVEIRMPSGAGPAIGSCGTEPDAACTGGGGDYVIWDGMYLDEQYIDWVNDTGPVTFWSCYGCQILNSEVKGITRVINPDSNHDCIRIEHCIDCVVKNNYLHDIHNTGGSGDPVNASGIKVYFSDNLLIENNESLNNGGGIYVKGGDNNNIVVRYNYVHDNSVGLELSYSLNVSYYQNISRDNTYGLKFWGGLNNVTFANNTFANNTYGIEVYDPAVGWTNVKAWNNIITTGTNGIDAGNFPSYPGFVSNYNLVNGYSNYGSWNGANYSTRASLRSATGWESDGSDTTFQSDPLYVNAGAGDFHLQAGSPARNVGIDILDLDNDASTTDPITMGAYITGNEVIGIDSGPDTTPPVLSAGAPTGELSAGTTQTNITLTTDENATCKWDVSSGTAYASMPNTFSTTGGTSHSTLVTGLSDGNSYTYYVRCSDVIPNVNTTDYQISFSVASGTGPGAIRGAVIRGGTVK